MEAGEEWTHPDISLPELLTLVRAFVEMLLFASGYHPTSASPAYWRAQDVQRALGWASLLEQIIGKISVHNKDKASKEALDRALHNFMLETAYPEGLPKLSCKSLGEAKRLLLYAISHSLGSGNGQIESLVTAAHRDEQDWEVVFQHVRDRFMAVESAKSAIKALELAVSLLSPGNSICGCQQWRQEALSYLMDARTLYKISGVTALFKCNERQWRKVLQNANTQAASSKSTEIVELCCLHMSQHRHSALLTKLMQRCDRMSCSDEASKLWNSFDHSMERVLSKETDPVEAFAYELAQADEGIWWRLSPILVAAALTKGSPLFELYCAQLSRPRHSKDDASSSYYMKGRCAGTAGGMLNSESSHKATHDARWWCLWLVEKTVEAGALK